MNRLLTKLQKQQLGVAVANVGYNASVDFVYLEILATKEKNASIVLTNRETSDVFTIFLGSGVYHVTYSLPGTGRERIVRSLSWDEVTTHLTRWAKSVKLESEAVDPWEQEAENMANDDSYFTAVELPRVDNAIDSSLEELKQKAVEHGKSLGRIEAELAEANALLKKTARNSTKREWLALFKAIVIEKLVNWGLQAAVLQQILHTLITSAHDVAQLADFAHHLIE